MVFLTKGEERGGTTVFTRAVLIVGEENQSDCGFIITSYEKSHRQAHDQVTGRLVTCRVKTVFTVGFRAENTGQWNLIWP